MKKKTYTVTIRLIDDIIVNARNEAEAEREAKGLLKAGYLDGRYTYKDFGIEDINEL